MLKSRLFQVKVDKIKEVQELLLRHSEDDKASRLSTDSRSELTALLNWEPAEGMGIEEAQAALDQLVGFLGFFVEKIMSPRSHDAKAGQALLDSGLSSDTSLVEEAERKTSSSRSAGTTSKSPTETEANESAAETEGDGGQEQETA